MIIYKCDNCKKAIKQKEEITAGFGGFMNSHNFCQKCAKPVAVFLNKHGFGEVKSKKLWTSKTGRIG